MKPAVGVADELIGTRICLYLQSLIPKFFEDQNSKLEIYKNMARLYIIVHNIQSRLRPALNTFNILYLPNITTRCPGYNIFHLKDFCPRDFSAQVVRDSMQNISLIKSIHLI